MGVLKTLTVNGVAYEVKPVVPASYVTLRASGWVGSNDSYSQVVPLVGITNQTKVDLQPTPEQVEIFLAKTLAFTTENNNGVVTVYSVGYKPEDDYTIQVTLIEAEGSPPIRGNTVGMPNPQVDWEQTNPKKADYIKNKPNVALAPDLHNHITNKANPHAVTAEQVGARADSWMPTPEEVGAAPSGYGLGTSGTWVDDLNAADRCGYYSWTSTAQNIPFAYGNMFVVRRSDGRLTQIGIDPCMVGHSGIVIRHYTGSNWRDWEWVNPPMNPGVAYKTTERWRGNAVYTKMVDLGALPNSTTKTIDIGVTSSKIIRSFVNITSSSGTNVTSPYFLADGTMVVKHLFTAKNIQIATTADYTDRSATVQVWYTE